MADDVVLQTFPLGFQWPTHRPVPLLRRTTTTTTRPATSELGPAASLEGRELGADFAGIDGWRMYHGEVVPGFPRAPAPRLRDRHVRAPRPDRPLRLARRHRPLRPRRHAVAHRRPRHRALGDVPARSTPTAPNPLELFQIWLNLPAADKMVDPYFTMLWETDTPRVVAKDDDGRVTEITVIAGELDGQPRAASAAELVGRARRGRRRDLAPALRARRGWSSRPRPDPTPCARCTCTKARVAHRRRTTIAAPTGVGARRPTSRSRSAAGDDGAEMPRCSRAARSASRSRSTARS